jgi:HEAT repeat protein
MMTTCTTTPPPLFDNSRDSRVAAERALLRQFDAAPPYASPAGDDLRRAATEYAHILRADGASPEQAVIALKSLLSRGGHRHVPSLYDEREPGDWNETRSSSPTRYAQVLRWCIEGYFEEPQ